MRSSARVLANRRNARRSTGPRTPGGKSRVAKNALRHGLAIPVTIDQLSPALPNVWRASLLGRMLVQFGSRARGASLRFRSTCGGYAALVLPCSMPRGHASMSAAWKNLWQAAWECSQPNWRVLIATNNEPYRDANLQSENLMNWCHAATLTMVVDLRIKK
jgi:hypothetical protein